MGALEEYCPLVRLLFLRARSHSPGAHHLRHGDAIGALMNGRQCWRLVVDDLGTQKMPSNSHNMWSLFASDLRRLCIMGAWRYRLIFSVAALAILGVARSSLLAEQIKDSSCLDCHADKTLSKTNAAGKEVSLFVDFAKLKGSAHKTNT